MAALRGEGGEDHAPAAGPLFPRGWATGRLSPLPPGSRRPKPCRDDPLRNHCAQFPEFQSTYPSLPQNCPVFCF